MPRRNTVHSWLIPRFHWLLHDGEFLALFSNFSGPGEESHRFGESRERRLWGRGTDGDYLGKSSEALGLSWNRVGVWDCQLGNGQDKWKAQI